MTTPTPVPRGGLLLHIGPHKTGTTSVQRAFVAHRDDVAQWGIAYGSAHEAPHGAVIARLGTAHGWYDEIPPFRMRRWEKLCARTRELSETVVVSSEAMCHADDAQAASVCGELCPGRPARIVITLRPLELLLPSSWQEYIKAGWTTSYPEFLDWTLRRPDDPRNPVRTFWVRQDHGALVERWSRAVGAENVTVIVGDRIRPRVLLDGFEDLLGLPRGVLGADDAIASSNRSLTWQESELVRRANVAARERLTWKQYNTLFRHRAVRELVDMAATSGDPVGLPAWATVAAREHGAAALERIRATGVELVGSLSDLVPSTPVVDWTPPDAATVSMASLTAIASGFATAIASVRD